jgi:hypothetical protein
MATYRERREARAQRLEEWATKREAKAETDLARGRQMLDAIPLGQPILTDHYSARRDRNYRDRAWRAVGRSSAHADKAKQMRSIAAGIRSAADSAVYSDDSNAVERLRERIAERIAERERIKAYNATCRKGTPDLSVLDERQRATLEFVIRHSPYQLGKGGAFPSYALSNLGATIRKDEKRLETMVSEQ